MAQKRYDDYSKEELTRLLQSRDRRDATRCGLVWEADEIERDKALNQDIVALDLDPELSCPASPSPGTPAEGRGEGMPTLSALNEGEPFAIADHNDKRMIYVPHFRAKDGKALTKAVAGSPAVIVYTWQPELIKTRLQNANNAQVEPVPESLAIRFRMRI